MKVNKDKTYKTREGNEIRIYTTNGGGYHPVHGAILVMGVWFTHAWTETGGSSIRIDDDLVLIKQRIKRTGWANVYLDYTGPVYKTKLSADEYGEGRLACIKIEIDCEEGEGL